MAVESRPVNGPYTAVVVGQAQRLRVTHSPLMRAYLLAFFAVWTVILFGFTATLAADGSPVVLVPTVLLVLELSVGYRALRVSLVDDDGRLIVRNYFSTVRLSQGLVLDVEAAGGGRTSRFAAPVHLVTADGVNHSLDVFTRPLLTAGSRRRHASDLQRLQVQIHS